MTLTSVQQSEVLTKTDQVAEYIRDMVRSGKIQPGSRLPGDRDLAKQLGVAYLTIRRANQKLMEEGLLKREQGRGTFVNPVGGKPLIPSSPKIRHLTILFVDISPNIDYNMKEIIAIEQWLGQRGIYLSFATLSSADLAAGQFPPVLNEGRVDGLFLDGYVMDFHCAVAKRFNLPYVVVGNHKLSKEIPQVRVDYVGMAKKATNFLYDRFKLPVALFIEPFNCHYSYETFEGYLQTVSKLPQKQTILYNCPNNDATDQMTCLLESSIGKFSILTTDILYPSIQKALQHAGKDPREYPILVMGDTKRIPEEDRKKVFLMSTQAERLALRAAESLLEFIEQKREGIYEELSEDILMP